MLSRCNFWVAKDSPTFESPHQTGYIQQPAYLPNKVNLGQPLPTTVRPQPETAPFKESYLDDLFSCFFDQPRQIWQSSRVALLVLILFCQALLSNEPLIRDDMLSFEKTLAEGLPEETKVVLLVFSFTIIRS